MPDSPVDPPGRASSPRVAAGMSGLDDVLGGGFPSNRMHLIQGSPGTGKTTWGGQFLLNGVSRGEKVLFTTLTNTRDKLLALADSHRWSLEGIKIFELSAVEGRTAIGQPLKHRRQAVLSPDKACFPRSQSARACIAPIAKSRFEKIILDGCVVAHCETQKSLMNPPNWQPASLSDRVLVLAPIGRDASLVRDALTGRGCVPRVASACPICAGRSRRVQDWLFWRSNCQKQG